MFSKKGFFYGLIIGFLFIIGIANLSSCQSNVGVKTVTDPNTSIHAAQGNLTTDTQSLDKTTAQIKNDALQGEIKTPVNDKTVLGPFWTDILLGVGNQEAISTDLKTNVNNQLTQASTQVSTVNADLAQETARADKAEAQIKNLSKNKVYLLMIVGAFAIAIGGGLMFSGDKIGITIGVSGVILTVVSVVLIQLFSINPLWYLGLVVVAVGLGIAVAWYYYKHKTTIATVTTKNTVLEQTVDRLHNESRSVSLKLNTTLSNLQQNIAIHGEVSNRTTVLEDKMKNLEIKINSFESTLIGVEGTAKQTKAYVNGFSDAISHSKVAMTNWSNSNDIWTCRAA